MTQTEPACVPTRPACVPTEPTGGLTDAPAGATFDQARPPLLPPQRSMFDVLVLGRRSGVSLQDPVAIPSSIPWLRSQRYWARARVDVFTSGEVPYGVTNSGEPSRKAVEMYLASLRAAERCGCREDSSYVLELGTGMGLFAKLFLDQLRDRSMSDYERTKGLLEDTLQSGVLAAHEERVRRIHLPTRDWRAALFAALPKAAGVIRAVHGNYLLDSLPFTILSWFDGRLFELRIRTRLREELLRGGIRPPSTTDALEVESWLADVLESAPDSANTALQFEAEYVPVEPASVPLADLIPKPTHAAPTNADRHASVQVLHGYGAIELLTEVLGALRTDGYFLAMDYNLQCPRGGPIEFQTYGASVAAGVNFDQLVAFAQARPDCQVGVPPEDPTFLQARCFARGAVPAEVIQLFEAVYSKAADDRMEAPYRAARELARENHFEAARANFEEACRLQPCNWMLLETIGSFLANTLHEHDAALEVTRRALLLNPLAPELWNLLGDGHFNMEDVAAAERAYREAVRLSPRHPRGHANLAYVFLKRGHNAEALRAIGQALALDRFGELREELLSKQAEALAAREVEAQRDKRHAMNRRSGHYALPGRVPAPRPSSAVGSSR